MNKPAAKLNSSNSSELGKYLQLILKYWYWFFLSLTIAYVIAKSINILSTRYYRVSCDIVVGEDENSMVNSPKMIGGMDFSQYNSINKEIGIIKSKRLAEQTVANLDFDITYYEVVRYPLIKRRRYGNVPFEILPTEGSRNPTGVEVYLKMLENGKCLVRINGSYGVEKEIGIGETFEHEDFSFKLNSHPELWSNNIGADYLVIFNSHSKLVREYWRNLRVYPSSTSQNIITLSLTGENINQLIDYLHLLCEHYIENDKQLRNRMATNTIEFIDSQLDILSDQLQIAEDSLIRFKRANRIFEAERSRNFSSDLVKIEETIKEIEFQSQSFEIMHNKLDSIRKGKSMVIPSLLIADDSKLSNGIEGLNRLAIERELKLKNQRVISPEIKELNQRLEVEAIALQSYIEEQMHMMQQRMTQLKNEEVILHRELLNLPLAERKLLKLQRDFELTENLYNQYQQKRIEANLAKASTVSKIRILDEADRASAVMVSPKAKQNQRMAVVLGLLFPLGVIVVRSILSNKILETNEVKNHLNSSVIGKIVHSRAKADLPTHEFTWSAITESFRTLYAKLNYLMPAEKLQVMAVTSGASGEGKTFCAANLAAVMASSGKKVLLIGMDLRKPKIHQIFNLDNEIGISTYLVNRTKLEDIIIDTGIQNLSIICSGPVPPNPLELIEQESMGQLMQYCRAKFDIILFDTPPIGLVADTLMLNRYVDVNLFIVRIAHTKKNILPFLRELEESKSINRLNLVVNDIKQQEKYGGGYYNYYYQREVEPKWRRKIRKYIFQR